MQFVTYIILKEIIPSEQIIIRTYHYGILLFNLLPIYPLDGGKLLHLLLSIFLPYKFSLKITIYLSYIFIIMLILINIKAIKINIIIMIMFLLIKVYIEQSKINYIYEKFILERYLNNYYFKTSKLINSDRLFYKNKRHIIKEKHNYFLEKEYLQKKFKKYIDNTNTLC